jgi:FAD synthase
MTDLFTGVAVEGSRRATALGFPTVNIPYDGSVGGVYTALVTIDERSYFAAAFADQQRGVLEAHLLDFPSADLYGAAVEIRLERKIRDSQFFDNDAALRAAITSDVEAVRDFYKKGPPGSSSPVPRR